MLKISDHWRKFVVPKKHQFSLKYTSVRGKLFQRDIRSREGYYFLLFIYTSICFVLSIECHAMLCRGRNATRKLWTYGRLIARRKSGIALHIRCKSIYQFRQNRVFLRHITQQLTVQLRNMNKLDCSINSRREGYSLIVVVVVVVMMKKTAQQAIIRPY